MIGQEILKKLLIFFFPYCCIYVTKDFDYLQAKM
jgi:hypothetical protein